MNKIKALYRLLSLIVNNQKFLKKHRNSIVISSMQKSGTNYLRLLLSNYFFNLLTKTEVFENLEYDRMHSELFPNVREDIINGNSQYQNPKINLHFTDKVFYSDFMYDHGSITEAFIDRSGFLSRILSPKNTIFLFRNPYDITISRFYYFYKNRIEKENEHEHPRELINSFIPVFCRRYKQMKRLSNNKNNLMIAYEDLKDDTVNTFIKILNQLEIPVDNELIKSSIDAASIKSVKKTEKKIGKAIHAPKVGFKGSFVRSGKTGQWQNYFNENDLSQINQILSNNSISIDDFTTTERC